MIGRWLGMLAALALAGCNDAEQQWPDPAPALWQVTSPTGETGWLFGTIHALPDGARWRTPELAQALDNSSLLIVEIADAGASDPALFDRLAHTPGQAPLAARLSPQWHDDLAAALAATGQDQSDFADVETWAAALMLSGNRSGDPANGVDKALLADAGARLSLESRAGQLGMFDQLPPEDQIVLLENALDEASAADPLLAVRAWITGDMDTIDRMARAGLLADASLRETLLIARNGAWVGPISAAIDAGQRPVVAVGAVHMAGVDGLPALLAARGYTVERVQ